MRRIGVQTWVIAMAVVWSHFQRDLGVSLNKVGDVRLAVGDLPEALAVHEESLVIMRKLAAADPGKPVWQRELSVSLNNIGYVRLEAGDRPWHPACHWAIVGSRAPRIPASWIERVARLDPHR